LDFTLEESVSERTKNTFVAFPENGMNDQVQQRASRLTGWPFLCVHLGFTVSPRRSSPGFPWENAYALLALESGTLKVGFVGLQRDDLFSCPEYIPSNPRRKQAIQSHAKFFRFGGLKHMVERLDFASHMVQELRERLMFRFLVQSK
jgi:hypothetical protein